MLGTARMVRWCVDLRCPKPGPRPPLTRLHVNIGGPISKDTTNFLLV